jgi:hypothetical protein
MPLLQDGDFASVFHMQLGWDYLDREFPLTWIGRGGRIVRVIAEHLASCFGDSEQICLWSTIAHYIVSTLCKAMATVTPKIMLTDVWTDL